MKFRWYRMNMKQFRKFSTLLVLMLLVFGLLRPQLVSAAPAAALYMSINTQNVTQGGNFKVSIFENSGSDPVNAVQADFTYPSNLSFVNIDSSSSAFPVEAQATGGSGSVQIARGSSTPLTGNRLVAVVNFTVNATGTGNLTFSNTSQVVSSSSNTNILSVSTGCPLAVPISSTLASGQTMCIGQSLISNNVRFKFVMQSDGNLVLYGNNFRPLWASYSNGLNATHTVMQSDGNLVIYTAFNRPVWASSTPGNGPSNLVMQDDGNAVVYAGSTPKWNSGTAISPVFTSGNSDRLTGGQTLLANYYLKTADNLHGLIMQPDGNLVLYGAGYRVLWASYSNGQGANRVVMQTDGNMVIYTATNRAIWATYTNGKGADKAVVQTDGNFVIYAGSTPKWWTGTDGKF